MTTRWAKRPLNKEAVKKANEAVWKKMSSPRKLTMSPKDKKRRKIWMDAYLKNGGEAISVEIGEPIIECPPKKGTLFVFANTYDDFPLEGADIVIWGPEIRHGSTDENGIAVFSELTPGDYEVSGLKDGFSDDEGSASVIADSSESCDLVLLASLGLGSDVDNEVSKSPKFTKLTQDLLADGWSFEYGPAGQGSYCDKQSKTIIIDKNTQGNTRSVLTTLAHEGGHARYEADPYVPHNGLTRDEYVSRNVQRNLKDEGEATLTNIEMRDDLKKHGGMRIDIAGAQAAKYEAIHKKYPDDKDRDQARSEIGEEFADGEKVSRPPNPSYREYYSEPFRDHYDGLPDNEKTPEEAQDFGFA